MITMQNDSVMAEKLSIYIHIPFCARKCLYCDFLSFPMGEKQQRNYVERLLEEIRSEAPGYSAYEVDTVFIGGGTPSVLKPEWICEILAAVKEYFSVLPDAEISMEVNPGTAGEKALQAYHEAGINRLSIGLQSAQQRELQLLGRIHSYQDFLTCFQSAKNAGFTNMNVDLMLGLPGQKTEDILDTVQKIVLLHPQHISVYSLIVEEGTVFEKVFGEKREDVSKQYPFLYGIKLPEDEEERRMYYEVRFLLQEHGFHQYEISNYAREGYECRHNKGYWTDHDYVGFGLGAASKVQHIRWKNTEDMKRYLRQKGQNFTEEEPQNIIQDRQVLSEKDRMEEFMFLGLRLTEGISAGCFQKRFGRSIEEVYGSWLRKMLQEKLLCREEDRIYLSNKGMDLANYVMSGFLLD